MKQAKSKSILYIAVKCVYRYIYINHVYLSLSLQRHQYDLCLRMFFPDVYSRSFWKFVGGFVCF